ncbi:uncharacterized protein EDB91DRAFT_1078293 [Suillus paluster]|uniref:uncharacterized protein n=1 Tax=Suillus paluster TaxID=48578 RepID=UPI001B87B247|nr:uncharacterized protein EDB91DRAFT_1078293 [Suillus paluster]KAG1751526.1 hypothetical protein EDB91DRAFT_1078293 [Suillus paluster]
MATTMTYPYLANATWAVHRNGTVTIELPQLVTFVCDDVNLTAASTGLKTCSDEWLQRLESWIEASRAKLNGKRYLLVVEPIVAREKEIYPYYYIVPENHIITWVEPVNVYLLFQESIASHWNHKRLELEAQYWKHVEYFPHEITIPLLEIRALRIQLNWYHVEELAKSDGIMKGPGVAICGHHEYLNHHGQPEARLIRMHSLAKKRRDLEDSPFMAGAAVVMLWIPLMVLRCLKKIYVDGLVNGVDIRSFTDDFSAQAKAQATVASVIMAVNASILAVPGLGTQLTTKMMCSISFVLSFYCIIGGAMAQHFSHRLRSLDFVVYYLQGKMASLAIIASIPSFLYLTSMISKASSRALPDLYEAAIAELVIPRRQKVDGPWCSHEHFSTLEFTGLRNAGCLYRTDCKSEEPLIEKNLRLDGSTLSVFGQSASQAGRPTSISLNCIGSSFSLSSTWVTSGVQEKNFKAFQAELAMQAGLMVMSLATRCNNAHLHNLGLDLLILQAKLCRAQAEMELYMMAIENSHVCSFCDGSLSTSPDLIVPRHLPEEVDLIHNDDNDKDEDEDDDSNGTGSKDYDDIDVW